MMEMESDVQNGELNAGYHIKEHKNIYLKLVSKVLGHHKQCKVCCKQLACLEVGFFSKSFLSEKGLFLVISVKRNTAQCSLCFEFCFYPENVTLDF